MGRSLGMLIRLCVGVLSLKENSFHVHGTVAATAILRSAENAHQMSYGTVPFMEH